VAVGGVVVALVPLTLDGGGFVVVPEELHAATVKPASAAVAAASRRKLMNAGGRTRGVGRLPS
jgi:hypothetical protein